MYTGQMDENMQKQVAAFVVVARMQQRLLPRIGVQRRARSIDTYECYQDLLNNIDPTTWRRYFRFTKEEFLELYPALQIPDAYIYASHGHKCWAPLALLMLFARLAWPRALKTDLALLFQQDGTRICRFVNKMMEHIYTRFDYTLTCDKQRLRAHLGIFGEAVGRILGFPPHLRHHCKCWAFVDGTFRYTCRPEWRQDVLYNGHYGGHGFKYQFVVTPDGIVIDLYGPCAGRHHDAHLVEESELVDTLASFCVVGDESYYIYGDKAYPAGEFIQRPIQKVIMSVEEEDANARYSSARVAVEHLIGAVSNTWQALEFKRTEKVCLSAVALRYRVGVFLYNCLTCMRGGNQVSQRFMVEPPTLQQFLRPQHEREL